MLKRDPVSAPYSFHASVYDGASIGTGMKNTTAPPTLESLIKKRIKEKGLSRSELVSAIGYSSNVSKGCRRLDTFTGTLEYPSEEFINKITSALEIDPPTFYRAT